MTSYVAFFVQESWKEKETKIQTQMKEARKVIQELETDKAMAIAEAKQQMHVTMETKDNELQTVRTACQTFKQERDELSEKVEKLEKTGK